MKRKNIFIVKFVAVAVALGFFAPSITLEKVDHRGESNLMLLSDMTLSKGLIEDLTLSDISISLFTRANARGGRRVARRSGRRAGRRAGRRSNYRHHVGHGHVHHVHHGGYYGPPVGAVAAGAVVGAAVGSAVAYGTSCRTVYIDGLRYRDCGGPLERY
jgi:hypothetical protein